MSHARIEEVSDSDLSDPSEGDIDDFVESDIMRKIEPKKQPTTTQPSASSRAPPLVNPAHAPPQAPQVQASDIKDYQCIYPVYFDATRSRAEGRRVPASLAVANPLAREIATACAQLRLQPVFEAHRAHPKDWANPGRVRVPLKRLRHLQGGPAAAAAGSQVRNKHHLYVLIARHLRANPTTERSDALRRVRVPGLGIPGQDDEGAPWPRPAVPRGWKIGELLPAYSAAMTGGGVSENAFKDMMKEMQQQGGPGGAGGGGPGGMMGGMADMMNMFGGMGGGGAGPSAGSAAAEGGGGKKGKKGKR
ncbi:hypothetical protein DL766_006249 [Monosporascus sp. MC13-8B]|uniref:Signal recognition particle SRP19 subunit n=1 Tax=Monosporascus cannonballus TaxID=155416 RepID=A0ABY0H3U4_9PEZI|nr:hypothetical protein DL762_005921 [Monosporascus cannonballus]RYO84748.1 hypothetical protein DL763_007365 [Monosporascus cannonballus]RYP27700.1 hypothetical protein DL766_006249 [Monosporascus sp. MC13-8B]